MLNFERTTKPASEAEVKAVAEKIFTILLEFKSPKDTSLALANVHLNFIMASFPPEYRVAAFTALDAHNRTIKNWLIETWP